MVTFPLFIAKFYDYMYIFGKMIKGSPIGNGLFHIHVRYIWSDLWRKSGKILKNGFQSLLGRGSKMKHFPFKGWHLKFSFSLFSKITILPNKKNHVFIS